MDSDKTNAFVLSQEVAKQVTAIYNNPYEPSVIANDKRATFLSEMISQYHGMLSQHFGFEIYNTRIDCLDGEYIDSSASRAEVLESKHFRMMLREVYGSIKDEDKIYDVCGAVFFRRCPEWFTAIPLFDFTLNHSIGCFIEQNEDKNYYNLYPCVFLDDYNIRSIETPPAKSFNVVGVITLPTIHNMRTNKCVKVTGLPGELEEVTSTLMYLASSAVAEALLDAMAPASESDDPLLAACRNLLLNSERVSRIVMGEYIKQLKERYESDELTKPITVHYRGKLTNYF